jgi:hypothetical protein
VLKGSGSLLTDLLGELTLAHELTVTQELGPLSLEITACISKFLRLRGVACTQVAKKLAPVLWKVLKDLLVVGQALVAALQLRMVVILAPNELIEGEIVVLIRRAPSARCFICR